jgi:arsenate reductase
VWLSRGKRVHLGFPDPAKAQGADAEVLAVFRSVRDDIARIIPAYLKEFSGVVYEPRLTAAR